MEKYFDKVSSFVIHLTSSIQSWTTILANIIAISFSLFFRNIIYQFYVTLNGMNSFLGNILFYLSIITAYSFIYRSASAIMAAISKFIQNRNFSHELAIKEAHLKKVLFSLPKKELSILKFIFYQDNHMAWLPEIQKDIISLTHKGIITPVSNYRKDIPHDSFFYSEPFSASRLFSIPDNILHFIALMPADFSKKWKKVKPDSSFLHLQ